ncbi:MAG TPA: bifunctional phosphopantothenoylcysteine decarboxylase/phosphopantothenate--cysteine ligase CoaBC [Oscillatoriaceae cyanobacterium]
MPTLLLGISGGIAAYKAVDLASRLRKRGWEVHVVMTEAATRFVTPLTFESISRHPVHVDAWAETGTGGIEHIDVARLADVFLVCPATANTLAKLAHGFADDLLGAIALATTAPLLLAPAMNPAMWAHPATQANLELLKSRGARVVMPEAGEMACGEVGTGRLAEPETIADACDALLKRDLAGVRVLVSAGGTREPLDPVRYLGNRSSGKMGYAIAETAARRGATVTLVTASSLPAPAGVETVPVGTALEMRDAIRARFEAQDVVVMAAAVADYRPESAVPHKRKKSGEPWELTLVPNPDILAELGQIKTHQLLVGFAAETGDPIEAARGKLSRKNADYIVANDVSVPEQGFEVDTNRVIVVGRDGVTTEWPLMSKRAIGERLWDLWAPRLRAEMLPTR